jgi:DNA repair photolyase
MVMELDLPILNPDIKGRGAQINPVHRFSNEDRGTAAYLYYADEDDETVTVKTKVIKIKSKSIVNKVESEDVPGEYSLNPYQGCEHGCIYCYARNTHPYWGYSAGIDFESNIMVKENAADLLDELLSKKSWKASPIMLSGNTDCYQPIEKELEITRSLLKVFLKHKHPLSIVTKNALILRDLDILTELNKLNLVSIAISITTIDDDLRRIMEPRTSSIPKRMALVKKLTQAGLPVTVLAAPIIPGLNENDILPLAKQVAENGAKRLQHIVVRLNGDIQDVFSDWLDRHFKDRKNKVLSKIKSLHGGDLGSSDIGLRMKGEGKIADIIHQQFKLAKKLYMLDAPPFQYNLESYGNRHGVQMSLF